MVLEIEGSAFSIRLRSNDSGEAYGFSIDNITAISYTDHCLGEHEWEEEIHYEWSEDNDDVTAWRECKYCSDIDQETVETTVMDHSHCEEEGEVVYTATFINPAFETQTKTMVVPATGHNPGDAVHENETEPTSTEDGGYDLVVYCTICGNELSREHVVVTGSIKITKQPESVVVEHESDLASFTVEAEGDGLTYCWYHKNPGQTKFYLTKCYTASTEPLEVTKARDGREMYCVITDAYGNQVETEHVTMSVRPRTELKITKQPESVVVENAGDLANFTVEAEGDGLQYCWYHKNPGQTKFYLTKCYTASTDPLEVTKARDGREMYCVITDAYGNQVETEHVTMSICPRTELKITKQPESIVVENVGDLASFTVEAEGDGLTYCWYHKNPSHTKFYETKCYTASTEPLEVTKARDGREMYCVITDAYGNQVETEHVTMSIRKPAELKITKQPESVVVANIGDLASFTVEAEGEGLTYCWYHKNPGQTKFYLTKCYTASTEPLEVTKARNDRQMYCVITDAYGNTVTTDVVTMSVAE